MTQVSATYPAIAAPSRRVEAYAVCLAAAALVTWVVLIDRLGPPAAAWWIVALLAGVAFLAERQCVAIGANTEMSISVLPILFAAVVFGPVAAMIVSACSLVGECGRPYTRWIVWTSSRALIGAFAGLCALGLADRAESFGAVLLAVAVAAAVQAVGDILLNGLTVAIRRSGSVFETARAIARLTASTLPLYTPVLAVWFMHIESSRPGPFCCSLFPRLPLSDSWFFIRSSVNLSRSWRPPTPGSRHRVSRLPVLW